MSSDIAINVENLSKCYHIFAKPRDRLLQGIMPRMQRLTGRPPKQYCSEFWALQDVSFEVKKGETFGIIGKNGSGKSTLLQIICGTLTPTSGSIQTNGRVAALLELGAGFNPEFSGRENVYMNASIHGLTKEDIDARFDKIAAFADIGQFIEQPVKTYSSGMFTRLAFACSIHVDPEILVVDEALSVGDAQFQAKCISRMKQIAKSGCTILFVSHDIASVKSFCQQAIYLKAGHVKALGAAGEVADLYLHDARETMIGENTCLTTETKIRNHPTTRTTSAPDEQEFPAFIADLSLDDRVQLFRQGTGAVRVRAVQLLADDNQELHQAHFKQHVRLRIHLECMQNVRDVFVGYHIRDQKNIELVGSGTTIENDELLRGESGDTFIIEFATNLALHAGIYNISIVVSVPLIRNKSALFLDYIENILFFEVLECEPHRIWSKVYLDAPMQIWKMPKE